MADRLSISALTDPQTIENSDPALRIRSYDEALDIDMAIAHEGTETETWTITLGLRVSGAALNLSDYTVTNLYVTGSDGQPVNTSGKFGIISASQGTVYYRPASGDLVASKSPYRVRVEITETASSRTRLFPSKKPDEIIVHPLR